MIPLSSRFRRALLYTMVVHANDRRATGVPAFGHLMGVASIVIDNGGDEDEAIAALLHDTPEDFGGEVRLEDIRKRFGMRVAEIVRGCSDSLTPTKAGRPPWLNRKRAYIANLPTKHASVWKVAVADKLNNSRAMFREAREGGNEFWRSLRRTPEETIAYLAAVHWVLQAKHPSHPTNELGLMVAQLTASYCDPSRFRDSLNALTA